MRLLSRLGVIAIISTLFCASGFANGVWPIEKAKAWHQHTSWLVGSNFIPSSAINEIEMWQVLDEATIDRELGLAERLGFNNMRVFLHNIPWEQDREAFLGRMNKFLEIAARHHVGITFVLFDSCWDPFPKAGPQRLPTPGLHNSGWVQCPGTKDLQDPSRRGALEAYVKSVIGTFKNDLRVRYWDIYNEPDNCNDSSYGKDNLKTELENKVKVELSLSLLKSAFGWAREVNPSQPLTSAPWQGDWSSPQLLSETARFQFENSDVISFHMYANLKQTSRRVEMLRRYDRPLFCSEYMARPVGSTFQAILPYFKQEKIDACNWGFVAGKSNTIYAWDTWQHVNKGEPPVWFHDIFRPDGKAYDEKEVALIRELTRGER